MANEEHLRKAFAFFDKNGSGFIEIEELRNALRDELDTNSEEVINAIMRDVDTDKVSSSKCYFCLCIYIYIQVVGLYWQCTILFRHFNSWPFTHSWKKNKILNKLQNWYSLSQSKSDFPFLRTSKITVPNLKLVKLVLRMNIKNSKLAWILKSRENWIWGWKFTALIFLYRVMHMQCATLSTVLGSELLTKGISLYTYIYRIYIYWKRWKFSSVWKSLVFMHF